jgi:RimJ/RimL family protein N-acetyltransferase
VPGQWVEAGQRLVEDQQPGPPGQREGEGKLRLLAAHAWHQGFATEAATAALDTGFHGAGLAEIWSITAVVNKPSEAVMRRLGMTLHAHFDHPRLKPGHPLRPHVAYRLARPGPARPAAE